jgi:rhodanese-related sulfurtransferase
MSATTISITQMQSIFGKAPEPNIVDVRTPAEFDRVHATGARLMPLDRLDPAGLAGGEQPIYLICQSGARAAKAWEKLQTAGISNAAVIEGGTAAWEAAGLPVVRGKSKVISMERQVRITAGAVVVAGVILTIAISKWFLIIPGFVGCGLVFAGITDFCGMAMVLAKMPWNAGK